MADIAKLSVGRGGVLHPRAANDHEQGRSGHRESPGRWYGAGASSLWLQGDPIGGWVAAMLEGRHRATLLTERALGKRPNRLALRVVRSYYA